MPYVTVLFTISAVPIFSLFNSLFNPQIGGKSWKGRHRKKALDEIPFLNIENSSCEGVMSLAIQHGHGAIVRVLLKRESTQIRQIDMHADIHCALQCDMGMSPLLGCCSRMQRTENIGIRYVVFRRDSTGWIAIYG